MTGTLLIAEADRLPPNKPLWLARHPGGPHQVPAVGAMLKWPVHQQRQIAVRQEEKEKRVSFEAGCSGLPDPHDNTPRRILASEP